MQTRRDVYKVSTSVCLEFQKLASCPHCGEIMNTVVESASNPIDRYRLLFLTCTSIECGKKHACLYSVRNSVISGAKTIERLELLYSYPSPVPPEITRELRETSPRFVDLYTQSFIAEQAGCEDVAACGYRNAVEALVKDYAHKYKGIPLDEALTRKPLHKCIIEYLDGLDESVAAYMVKELGNSATHYPPLGEPPDFSEQKAYLEIFLSFMTNAIKTRNLLLILPERLRESLGSPAPVGLPPDE